MRYPLFVSHHPAPHGRVRILAQEEHVVEVDLEERL